MLNQIRLNLIENAGSRGYARRSLPANSAVSRRLARGTSPRNALALNRRDKTPFAELLRVIRGNSTSCSVHACSRVQPRCAKAGDFIAAAVLY